MRILAYFLLTLLLGFATFWLHKHPSVVSFAGYGYQISTSLSVIFVGGVILIFLLRFLYQASIWIFQIPTTLKSSWNTYRQEKNQKVFASVVLNSLHGEFPYAVKEGEKIAGAYKNDPFFNYVYGCSHLENQNVAEAQLYFEAMIQEPAQKLMGFAGLADCKRAQNDLIGERNALEQILDLEPHAVWALKALFENLKNLQEYKKAKEILSRIEDLSFMTESEIKAAWADLYWQDSKSAQLSDVEKEKRLRQAHFLMPNDPQIAIDLAEQLKKMDKIRQGIDVLASTWNMNPTQSLGDAYASFFKELNGLEVYQQIKKLTQSEALNYESLLLRARYALQASLWGEARQDLMILVDSFPTPEIYKLLSDLEMHEHGDEGKACAWLVKAVS